ncbi:DUF7373 family lipoprotein [Streptomyces sp. NPDC002690]
MQILTGLATGAATAVGNGVGQAVGDLVQARLGRSEEGRAALDGVGADPADPAAVQGLQEAIREALATDPDFRDSMASALAGPPPAAPPPPAAGPQYTGSIIIGSGSRIRSSQISLGPLTINNTRAARVSLVGIAVLQVGLLALSLYGGVQLFTGDDSRPPAAEASPDPTPGTAKPSGPASGTSDASAPGALDTARARQILPDAASLPTGWTFTVSPEDQCNSGRVGISADDESHYVCRTGSVPDLQAEYSPGPGADYDTVSVEVLAYPSAAEAADGFAAVEVENASANETQQVTPVTLPSYGDESSAVTMTAHVDALGVDISKGFSVVRCESLVVRVAISDADSSDVDLDTLEAFTRAVTTRAQQSLDGKPPTAAVEL